MLRRVPPPPRPPEQPDLLVVADSAEGGLGAAASAHCQWFADLGWSVVLACPAPPPLPGVTTVDLLVPTGIARARDTLQASRALRRLIRRMSPALVHAHGTRSQAICLLAGRLPIVTMHGAGGRIAGQSAVGAASRASLRRLAARLAARAYSAAPAPGRWELLLHASPQLARLDSTPPPPGGTAVFTWLGRLEPPKRPELFVEAVALAARHHPLRGVVVGDGPMLPALRDLANDLDAPMEFTGAQRDVGPFLAASTAVCLFSDFEGIPFTVQEAMWVGRALVLSPLPSLRWFAGDGALYATNASEAAAAMRSLTEGTAKDLGARAAERIRGLLSPEAPFPALEWDYRARLAKTSR